MEIKKVGLSGVKNLADIAKKSVLQGLELRSLSSQKIALEGTEFRGLGQPLERVNPNEKLSVTVLLKHSNPLEKPKSGFVSLKKFEAKPEDIDALKKFAESNGLKIASRKEGDRAIVLEGKAGDFEKAFGVKLNHYKHPEGGKFRAYSGKIQLPQELAKSVEGVFGLSNKPLWKPRKVGPFATGQVTMSYKATDLAQIYNFPKGTDGSGQTIAVVEFGGGYKTSDLQRYFKNLGIPMPDIEAVGVDGATNSPTGDPNGPDGEVEMDIEAIGAMAPKAKIKVYFAPNDDQGSIDILKAIMNDPDHPNVVSISWGGDESSWTPATIQAMNNLFKEMAAKGITVIAASGDDGSTDGNSDGNNHVDFPASSPYVLGVGGTTLQAKNGKWTGETVWNNQNGIFGGGATGGGYSAIFAEPDYQSQAKITDSSNMRGVPDVASEADPNTGVSFIADGQEGVFGGTSLAAPTWAALVARMNQALATQGMGPVGFLNPIIYQILSNPQLYPTAFHDITQGDNGGFSAGPGWDPTTGAGSPNGQGLLAAVQKILSAQQTNQPSHLERVA
jgi:kumamolisin